MLDNIFSSSPASDKASIVHGNNFQPSLMLVNKAWAYRSEASSLHSPLRQTSGPVLYEIITDL
jgi:hypothetical protein